MSNAAAYRFIAYNLSNVLCIVALIHFTGSTQVLPTISALIHVALFFRKEV